jgi:hypothetical protein
MKVTSQMCSPTWVTDVSGQLVERAGVPELALPGLELVELNNTHPVTSVCPRAMH